MHMARTVGGMLLVWLGPCPLFGEAAADLRGAEAPEPTPADRVQHPPGRRHQRPPLADAAWHLRQNPLCGLITVDGNGMPRSRLVHVVSDASDSPSSGENESTFPSKLYVGTKLDTRKVGQIRSDPHVTVYCSGNKPTWYVSVMCTAKIVAGVTPEMVEDIFPRSPTTSRHLAKFGHWALVRDWSQPTCRPSECGCRGGGRRGGSLSKCPGCCRWVMPNATLDPTGHRTLVLIEMKPLRIEAVILSGQEPLRNSWQPWSHDFE